MEVSFVSSWDEDEKKEKNTRDCDDFVVKKGGSVEMEWKRAARYDIRCRRRRGGGKGSTDEGWNGFEEVWSGVAEEETIKQVSRVHKQAERHSMRIYK